MVKRHNIFFIALFLMMVFAVNDSAAQSKLIDFGVTYIAPNQNKDSAFDTQIQRTVTWIKINGPIKITEDDNLLLGVNYEVQFVEYKDFKPMTIDGKVVLERDLPEDLHALDLSIGWARTWTKEWSTVLKFTPGLHSDFKEVKEDDVAFTGSGLVRWKMDEKSSFGLGAAFSEAFGDPSAIPLVDINWHPTETFFIKGLLPLNIDVNYQVLEELGIGIEGKLNGYRYRLTDNQPWDRAVLVYREVRVGPFIDFKIGELGHLKVSGGVVTAQKFEINDKNNSDELVGGDYEDTLYASLSMNIPF